MLCRVSVKRQYESHSTDPWVLEQGQTVKGRESYCTFWKQPLACFWDLVEARTSNMTVWLEPPLMCWDYEICKVIRSPRNRRNPLYDRNSTYRIRLSRSRGKLHKQVASTSTFLCYLDAFPSIYTHALMEAFLWPTHRGGNICMVIGGLAQNIYDGWKRTVTKYSPTQRWPWRAVEKGSFPSGYTSEQHMWLHTLYAGRNCLRYSYAQTTGLTEGSADWSGSWKEHR